MKVIGIIPARYGSTRFPGKPLAMIGNKPMIQWVYEQAKQALDDVCVATDDGRIVDAVKRFGGKVIYTSKSCRNGTERCAEAARELLLPPDTIVVNIQGDMPFILPMYIAKLVRLMVKDSTVNIGTIVSSALSKEDEYDPNCVKAYIMEDGLIRDFSRKRYNPHFSRVMKHVGVYAYRMNILQNIVRFEETDRERGKNLEQLIWMKEYSIHYVHVLGEVVISVDTPEDLIRAEEYAEKERPKEMTAEKKTAEEYYCRKWNFAYSQIEGFGKFKNIRFSFKDIIEMLNEFAAQQVAEATKDCYPKEFVMWCIVWVFEMKGEYYLHKKSEVGRKYASISEIYSYWETLPKYMKK
jgi:3-deoxy-manno-octulosonate cytidylyltransferase (CMP-KDO synthetase)